MTDIQVVKLKQNTTSKKVKVVGTEEYLNPATGEIIPMQVTEIEERDFNFTKVWMQNFIASLDIIGNQKMHTALWIIDHLDRDNRLVATIDEVAEGTEVSKETARVTMKVLQEANFLNKVRNGLYVVNPNILYKGSRGNRLDCLNRYKAIDAPKIEISKAEQIQNLEKSINIMQAKLSKLKDEIKNVEVEGQLSFDEDGNIYQETREVTDDEEANNSTNTR